jgi:hypothetical protein
MEKKICCRCKLEKDVCDFRKLKTSKDGLTYQCRVCLTKKQFDYRKKYNETYKKYLSDNREKRIEYLKNYNKENKEDIKIKRKESYENKKDIILQKNREYHQTNKEQIRIRKKNYVKTKRKEDIIFKLKMNVRTRISNFLRTKNIKKDNSTFMLIGCTPEELKVYLENLFRDGMTWENKHLWHIDHIIPLSSVETKEEIYKLCHYTNLQPLWSKENIKKSNKIL